MMTLRAAAALLPMAVAASTVSAAPLNLTLGRPDITAGLLSSNYNATTDTLTVTGPALVIDLDGVSPPDYGITGGTYTLIAMIDGTGHLSSGTLTITGSIAGLGASSPLLTASLTAFGFSSAPVTQVFEFTAATTGGSLQSYFGGQVGTVIGLGGGFNGSFASNFAGTAFGSADTARIPAPGVGALAAAAGLAATRRRRRA